MIAALVLVLALVTNAAEAEYDIVIGTYSNLGWDQPEPRDPDRDRGALKLWPGGLDGILPTPSPTPSPQALSSVSSHIPPDDAARLQEWLCWLPWDCDTASRIAYCEGNNPRAYNPTPVWIGGVEHHATGLMQMLLPLHQHRFDGDPYDPYVNAAAAYSLWQERGWVAWSCW